jgi:hypothetical protein
MEQVPGNVVEGFEEEVRVLEEPEHAEVDADAQAGEQPSEAARLVGVHPAGEEVVEGGRPCDEQRQPFVPGGVEVEAGHEQQINAHSRPRHRPVDGEDGDKEEEVLVGREQHARRPRTREREAGGV